MIKKILLAEDDEDDQKLFYDFLKHRTDINLLPVVEDGVRVVELLDSIMDENRIPDLIILDQNMPRMTGLQTLQNLKQQKRYSHIPVMIYSTYADSLLIETSSKMGALSVVTKPMTKAGYNQMIDDCLDQIGIK